MIYWDSWVVISLFRNALDLLIEKHISNKDIILIYAKNIYIEDLYIKIACIKYICFKNICIKDTGIKIIYVRNTCISNANVIKYLEIGLQFFWILQIMLYGIRSEIKISAGW